MNVISLNNILFIEFQKNIILNKHASLYKIFIEE